MEADRLYVSERSASEAGNKAVTSRKAESFQIRKRTNRNPDKSFDFGFVVILVNRGRPIGFA